ncbi:MAG: histidine--tRNA ligase [Flammeovirgaceae bacterium]|nr:MAG: histidine--tRNA ligase [Flammeovirgaceae bacterium]
MEKPGLPKGTRDFGPQVMARRNYIFRIIRTVFQHYGFQPLETPAMENIETLTGKYGDEGDQLLFRILNSGDFLKDVPENQKSESKSLVQHIAEKGLRYDLTVPFARYVVMNRHDITMPFKRYQMQPVWRADRPQKGRYREFYQCDADVVGTDSLICEAELILMIKEVMRGLQIPDYTIKVNHREILNGIAEVLGASGKETSLFVAIDKLDKIGEEGVQHELQTKGFTNAQCDNLFKLLRTGGNNKARLQSLADVFKRSPHGQKGLADINKVLELLDLYKQDDTHVDFDLALARGLSYYTGCIFEVKINGVAIGSVSGGGRYDNLTQAFGSKEKLSGVGISFGIDRIYDALEELKLFPASTQAAATVLVCHFDETSFAYGIGVLAQLRSKGIAAEIYPETAKLKKQLDYANKKQIPFAVVIGPEEITTGKPAVKNMNTGEQENLTPEEIIKKTKS